jgi:hypothetical protein
VGVSARAVRARRAAMAADSAEALGDGGWAGRVAVRVRARRREAVRSIWRTVGSFLTCRVLPLVVWGRTTCR